MFAVINTTVKQAQRMIAVAFARPVFNARPQHNDRKPCWGSNF